jgi:hypothetical protein
MAALHSAAAVNRLPPEFDPYANDSGRLGVSLVNLAELLLPILSTVEATRVAEVGAYAGDLSSLLLDEGLFVIAIDPSPQDELEALAKGRPELALRRETSLEALRNIELPDAVILDGDHNYFTVSEELRAIGERAPGAELPLLLLHDVCWPHGRRDDYFAPQLIPEEFRQPTVEWGGLHPDEPGIHSEGMPYRWPAAREGGPRNGVLTAVEDFVSVRERVRLAVVPVFFGLGVVWHEDAPWAAGLARLLEPWDRNPLLARLEQNRVRHLADERYLVVRGEFEAEREQRLDDLLRRLLGSHTFALAEQISRLRKGGRPAFSKEEVRRALAG